MAMFPLFFVTLLIVAIILIQKKPSEMWAKTEEHEPTSMVTTYPLIEEFSDFSCDFGQNDE
jgi:hypothetical protein